MSYFLLFAVLALAWGLQTYLAHRQAKTFLRAVAELRRQGRTAIGVSDTGRVRRKTYVALAADGAGRVADAMRLGGLTVWARPEAVPALVGTPLRELAGADDDPLHRAASMAAEALLSDRQELGEGDVDG